MSFPRLLGDVGGTNARFALQRAPGAAMTDLEVLPTAAHPSIEAAIRHYLGRHTDASPAWCAIGIANPVAGDRVSMTNHPWSFSIRDLQAALGFERLLVLNDFETLARALPQLPPQDLWQVGPGRARERATLALLGPGTGLGMAGLLPAGTAGWLPIVGEGGHQSLAAADDRDAAVIAALRRRFGHVSAERVLSGPGLVNLYEAGAAIAGLPCEALDAAELTRRALTGEPRCAEAVELFFGFLGGAAGDLALCLGAHGGVFVGGGIVPRLGDWIGRSAFRARFEAKGRFGPYLHAIPTWVIRSSFPPALLGAAQALDAAG